MQITAAMVNDLRQKTGVGMMTCKKALVEAEGNAEKAVEILRKQGAAVAAKRADKDAKEGRVFLVETADKAAAFELSCETEPVSKNADFEALAAAAAKAVETQNITTVDELKNASVDGSSINDRLQDVLVKIQENIGFRKLGVIKHSGSDVFGLYSHMGGKVGVVVRLEYTGTPSDTASLKRTAKDIAMQASAFSPVAVNNAAVPAETLAKEQEIARAQIVNEGKTKPEFVDRQIAGRVNKVLKELVLEDQEFFMSDKNPKRLAVKDYLMEAGKALGLSSLKVTDFVRFERGK